MVGLGLVALAVVILATAAMLGHVDHVADRLGEVWRRVRRRPPVPDTVAVEQLAADLRRLADLLEQTYASDQPAKMARLTAASLAYDYVLLSACRTLELPEPTTLPMRAVERLVTEADLARHGLDW